MNRYISLSSYDNFMLFVSRLFGAFFCDCCWEKRKKLEKLYDEVEERITKELDVVRLLKKVNNQNAATKASLLDSDLKFQINHAYKNIIDLDKESSEEEEEDEKNETVQKISPSSVINLTSLKQHKGNLKRMLDEAKIRARARRNLDG